MKRAAAAARSAAFTLCYFALTFLLCLFGVGVRIVARQRALGLAQFWVRRVIALMRPLAGIRLEVTGLEHLPVGRPCIIASQHQSEFDTLVWMVLVPRAAYVMKHELTRIPLFGPLLLAAGMIKVDRAGGAAAMRRLLRDASEAAQAGRQIVIFPEGTRVPPGRRVALQPGIAAIAARTALPVIPVATDSGRCWPRDLLGRRAGVIHVAIGPPIPPDTPREDLLASIEMFWRRSEQAAFQPVDKHVENRLPTSLGMRARVG
jgi:1-acyl-sn-glycerol-3-phosphate acyltransferase